MRCIFSSKEQDHETSLYAKGSRYYDPWSGRFFSTDPMASDSALAPWSPYHYYFDDPVRFKDPTGKWPDWTLFGVEVGTWIESQFNSAQNSIVNSMNYQDASSKQMQAEAEYHSSSPMIPTSKQMSALRFHAVSNFVYAESMGSIAGPGAAAGAEFLTAFPELSWPLTDTKAATLLYSDLKSSSGTTNVFGTAIVGVTSYFSKVPVGAAITGAGLGEWTYQSFVPPPQRVGF